MKCEFVCIVENMKNMTRWTFGGHHEDIAPYRMLLTIGINDFEFYITIFAQHMYLHASTFEKWLILKHMHPL